MFCDRPIKAEILYDAVNLCLIGLRIDQHIDRVANKVHAGKHDKRHDEEHQDALQGSSQDEGCHQTLTEIFCNPTPV